MNIMKDLIWPENLIRVRFLPIVIIKVIIGILLAPTVLFCAGQFFFMIDPAWPRLFGRGIIPLLLFLLALMVYLMLRFVIALNADVFTSEKLIIRYQFPARKSIRWKDISSIEVHHRKKTIEINTEDGKRFEIRGFRGPKISDRKIINDDFIEHSSYEYRFHGLSTGVTVNQYAAKIRRFIPAELIISM